MSQIEVNKIIPQTGTTVQFGEAGDTINVVGTLDGSGLTGLNASNLSTGTIPDARFPATLPAVSGANLTGIETGTAWQSSIKTSSFTAVAGQGYFINTTGGAVTMTLPGSASVGDTIEFIDYARTFETNALTINQNSLNFQGDSSNNPVYDIDGQGVVIIYSGATKGWIPISDDQVANKTTLEMTTLTGSIFVGSASTVTLAGRGFQTSGVLLNAVQRDDNIDVTFEITASSDTAATAAVPSSVYDNVTSGNVVTFTLTNTDGAESNKKTITASALPSGGTVTSDGNFNIHTFTSSGNFVNPVNNLSVDFLVIAGGGGGGSNNQGGGGGAGGYRNSYNSETSGGGASSESSLTLSNQTYAVTIGAGGSGSSLNTGNATNGSNSIFSSITSTGGGYGGSPAGNTPANSGGSGGGGQGDSGNTNGGAGTSGQGFAGGNKPTTQRGGGGGGAGEAGNTDGDGQGGDGLQSSINGTATFRGGGGGGGAVYNVASATPGGEGGGGAGTAYVGGAGNGQANTGGGGGGGGFDATATARAGAGGGSGIVIIRYDRTSI
jgi:hypothetical protein